MNLTIHADVSIKLDYTTIFKDIEHLVEDCGVENVFAQYQSLYQILTDVLRKKTSTSGLEFSGPFAMLGHICAESGYQKENRAGTIAVQKFRALCSKQERLKSHDSEELNTNFPFHVKAVSDFVSAVSCVKIPASLRKKLPANYLLDDCPLRLADSMKVMVSHFDDKYIYAFPDGEYEDELKISISYVREKEIIDFSHLTQIIKSGSLLNLVKPMSIGDAICAELIVFEPDFLVDVTAIASCFEAYGATPLTYLVNKISPREISQAMLLGNFAGQMLDEVIHNYDGILPDYKTSALAFFRENALALSACDIGADFHEEARNQRSNLELMVRKKFSEDSNIEMNKLLLEPSFFSDMLGIQGRMDLLQIDKKVLMEQKSGKQDEFRHTHRQPHYVQMLLYLALLHYGLGQPNSSVSTFLLYSKYPEGLIRESTNPALLRTAFRIRNEIVSLEHLLSNGGGRELYEKLNPEDLNVRQLDNRLWKEWIFPRLNSLLSQLHDADGLTKDYFYRFLSFISREHLLAKIGSPQRESSGFASLWNLNEAQKKEAGSILSELKLKYEEKEGGIIDEVTLLREKTDDDYMPNFRYGDAVVFYSYLYGSEPNVCEDMVFRSSVIGIDRGKVVLKLRNPQKNKIVFARGERNFWAIEPDLIESTFSALYRSLQSFLSAPSSIRDLLLAEREPESDETLSLNGHYGEHGEFDELVLRSKQAKDFFLLVGPPGTGKTSCGMVNILKEALTEKSSNVLLLAYTNRAVDEICSKLVKEKIDFLRIGTRHSCPEVYAKYLLCNKVGDCDNVSGIREMISKTRVFVATTAAMASNEALLTLKKFSLAIVDEASQILEPYILGLFCAQNNGKRAISKFVFIGDHKQLPAVVLQSKEESAVGEESLKSIGLTNCANSIFERLLYLYGDNLSITYRFVRQARMHAEVASFPNREFYQNSLEELLPWQKEKIIRFKTESTDKYKQILTKHRFAFLSVDSPKNSYSDKTNEAEALVIAELSMAIYELLAENGIPFDVDKTLGIIVPYRQQIAEVRSAIAKYNVDILENVMIDTVERYQGSERDFIIYGFTVKKIQQLNFLTSNVIKEGKTIIDRKLNVALTRARECMLVLGNDSVLNHDEIFGNLINFAKANNCYYKK